MSAGPQSSSPALDPYEPPATRLSPAQDADGAEAERWRFLRHETALRAMGFFCFIVGALMVFAAVVFGLMAITAFIAASSGAGSDDDLRLFALGTLLCAAAAAAFFWVGWDLRKLNPRVRWTASILAFLLLSDVPFGTVVAVALLALVHLPKGRRVVSVEHREIRELTSHIRDHSAHWSWVAAVVVALVGLTLLSAVAQRWSVWSLLPQVVSS